MGFFKRIKDIFNAKVDGKLSKFEANSKVSEYKLDRLFEDAKKEYNSVARVIAEQKYTLEENKRKIKEVRERVVRIEEAAKREAKLGNDDKAYALFEEAGALEEAINMSEENYKKSKDIFEKNLKELKQKKVQIEVLEIKKNNAKILSGLDALSADSIVPIYSALTELKDEIKKVEKRTTINSYTRDIVGDTNPDEELKDNNKKESILKKIQEAKEN